MKQKKHTLTHTHRQHRCLEEHHRSNGHTVTAPGLPATIASEVHGCMFALGLQGKW